jgi:hypothetical protein
MTVKQGWSRLRSADLRLTPHAAPTTSALAGWRFLTGLWTIGVLALLLWNARALPPTTVAAAGAGTGEITCYFDWDYPYFEISGTASCPWCGAISMEVDFGEGAGYGDNQVDPGPNFLNQWYHEFPPGPGTYRVCMSADDADGEACEACQNVVLYW